MEKSSVGACNLNRSFNVKKISAHFIGLINGISTSPHRDNGVLVDPKRIHGMCM